MNCKHADILIMQYAEKTIKPNDAKKLIKHLSICDDCRESFLAFDVCLDETEIHEAPADFADNVMMKVKEIKLALPVLKPPGLLSRIIPPTLPQGIKQVVVGISAILAGIILFIAMHLGLEIEFFYPASQFVLDQVEFLVPFVESISSNLSSSVGFSQFTFVFVPLLSLFLYVLHNTEPKSGDQAKA